MISGRVSTIRPVLSIMFGILYCPYDRWRQDERHLRRVDCLQGHGDAVKARAAAEVGLEGQDADDAVGLEHHLLYLDGKVRLLAVVEAVLPVDAGEDVEEAIADPLEQSGLKVGLDGGLVDEIGVKAVPKDPVVRRRHSANNHILSITGSRARCSPRPGFRWCRQRGCRRPSLRGCR